MYYTSFKNTRVDRYFISIDKPAIFEVLTIYENPALIFQSNGNVIVYAMAKYRINTKVVTAFLRDFNRRYKTAITLRQIQRAYKENRQLYLPEIDFVSKALENGI